MANTLLKHINAVLETGSIAAASRKIFISQPALSQFIRRVEEDYAICLFDRSVTPWRLTAEGEYLLECQKKIEAIDRDCRLYFKDCANLDAGEIIIGATTFRTTTLLNPVLAVYKKRHPKVAIKIMEGTSEEVIRWAAEGLVDCCFGVISMLPESLDKIPVFTDNILVALSRDYAKEVKTKKMPRKGQFPCVNFKSLENIPFVIMKRGQAYRGYFETICKKYAINPPIALETSTVLTTPELLATGIGGALIPSSLVPECQKHGLALFELDNELPRNDVSIAWKKTRHMRAATKAFITLAKTEIQKLPTQEKF